MLTGEVGKSKGSTNGRDWGKGDCQGAGEDPHLVMVRMMMMMVMLKEGSEKNFFRT